MPVLFNLISVLLSGLLSFFIARHVKPQASVRFSLDPFMDLSGKLLGGGFVFKKRGMVFKDVKVLKLSIASGRFSGVGIEHFHSNLKPCIKLNGFSIVGVNTLNNDRTRFDIPLGIRSQDTIILNINWIKRNSKAEFIVVGHTQNGFHETDVEATLFPGLCRDVEVLYGKSLIKNVNRMNFESEKLEELHDSL